AIAPNPDVYFDPNIWYLDEELRKQVKTFARSFIMTGQEAPESNKKLHIDLYKKTISADGIMGRKPYGCITKMFHIVGWCLTPSGNTPVSWSDRALVMGTCADNITGSEAEAVEQRFYFHPKGFVQSQWSAKCLDTEGNNGYDDATAMWRKCETQGNCYKFGVQYEPDMDGQGRTVEANWYDCQS
ncbi:unnamed protein product, partial [Symbiodinium sp. CCMP2456]